MSGIADKVKIAQDKDGMLRRAMERIIQLYTDKSHFVYELLQNAEDASAKSIRFIQYSDRLEVLHDGKPFTSKNLQGLCDIGKSDKVDNLNQIGEFGVGFKSVFGICDTVRLYSDPSHYAGTIDEEVVQFAVEIKDFTSPEDIQEEPISEEYTTRFVFPYAVGHKYSGFSDFQTLNKVLAQKLQNLGITTLLFMKHLEMIKYEIKISQEPISGEYLLEKEKINDHCSLVSALGVSGQSTDSNTSDIISYLKFSRKLDRYPLRTVDIAFPVKIENNEYQCIKATNPYVSVYFPTETESKLDFIVQGPYRTTPNRSSIPAEDTDNIYLAKETASLLRSSLLELKANGKLNMSFLKILPINKDRFGVEFSLISPSFRLFYPLYETVKDLFSNEAIIPSKSGEYVYAKFSKIARREDLVSVFSNDLLSQLIGDGNKYSWLPTYLTEDNKEYGQVFRYMANELKITLIRPEGLRTYFVANPNFLPDQSNDWLVELYGVFEKIPGEFSKSRYETNMTTANIIKTTTGEFVAPFRREGKNYIPNVFLPSPKIKSADINIVDLDLYTRCQHFFDDILQLQKPNEYEFIIKDIKRRYEDGQVNDDVQHIEDINHLLKYVKHEDYKDEVENVIKTIFVLKCTDGAFRSPYACRIYLPVSTDGINIEGYYRNTGQNVVFVDVDYYVNHNLETAKLCELGIRNSITTGESITAGTYDTGMYGKQPTWYTTGDFRWKFSVDALKEVLQYISQHPNAKDSVLKSQAIMKILILNENKLCGELHVGGNVQDRADEPCEMIHILCGERFFGWDGKWLYAESGELVSPKSIFRHEFSTAIYGRLRSDSIIFSLLGFRKTEADEIDELKKLIPQEKLDAYFENELLQRYGISTADLNEQYGSSSQRESVEEEVKLPFPTLNIRSWDALKKHAVEMLIFADPVRYEARIRSIRVSNHPKEKKAYLSNMYRHEGVNRFKFACQLCHDTCSSFEAVEIFLNPETELDPVNLCLCPNCATIYRTFRTKPTFVESMRKAFLETGELDITNDEHVTIALDDDNELWFTQTHFAEIRELMKLEEEAKSTKPAPAVQTTPDDEGEKSGMSVYDSYIGKKIQRKDGFLGEVVDIVRTNGKNICLKVHIIKGKDAGEYTEIQLEFLLKNKNVYSIID